MELEILLDYVASLSEEEKTKVLDEEFQRQRTLVNAICDAKRVRAQGGNMYA